MCSHRVEGFLKKKEEPIRHRMLGLHQRIYCYRVSWQIIASIICGAKVAEICGLQDFLRKFEK